MTCYHVERKLPFPSDHWDSFPNTFKSQSAAQEAAEHIATVYPDHEIRVVQTSRKTVDKITPQDND